MMKKTTEYFRVKEGRSTPPLVVSEREPDETVAQIIALAFIIAFLVIIFVAGSGKSSFDGLPQTSAAAEGAK